MMYGIFVGRPGTAIAQSETFVFTDLGEACAFSAWLTVQDISHDLVRLSDPTNMSAACSRVTHLINMQKGITTH